MAGAERTLMKRILVVGCGALIVGLAAVAYADRSSHEEMQKAMRVKLDYARGALEGLVTEKFELVLTNAASLRDLSQTNAYRRTGNPDYLRRSTNFVNSIERLMRAAKEQNLDR